MMDANTHQLVSNYEHEREMTALAREALYAELPKLSEEEVAEVAERLEWNVNTLKRKLGMLPPKEPVLSIRERIMPLLPTEWEKAEKTYERISGLLGVAEPTIKKIVKSIAHDGEIEFKGYATKYMGRDGFRQTEYRRPTDLGL